MAKKSKETGKIPVENQKNKNSICENSTLAPDSEKEQQLPILISHGITKVVGKGYIVFEITSQGSKVIDVKFLEPDIKHAAINKLQKQIQTRIRKVINKGE